jgi:DNA-binding ferritin-like protein (Dps family)
MILKSALRTTINDKLEEHEVEDRALADELLDAVVQEFCDDVFDDEDEDGEDPDTL